MIPISPTIQSFLNLKKYGKIHFLTFHGTKPFVFFLWFYWKMKWFLFCQFGLFGLRILRRAFHRLIWCWFRSRQKSFLIFIFICFRLFTWFVLMTFHKFIWLLLACFELFDGRGECGEGTHSKANKFSRRKFRKENQKQTD